MNEKDTTDWAGEWDRILVLADEKDKAVATRIGRGLLLGIGTSKGFIGIPPGKKVEALVDTRGPSNFAKAFRRWHDKRIIRAILLWAHPTARTTDGPNGLYTHSVGERREEGVVGGPKEES